MAWIGKDLKDHFMPTPLPKVGQEVMDNQNVDWFMFEAETF